MSAPPAPCMRARVRTRMRARVDARSRTPRPCVRAAQVRCAAVGAGVDTRGAAAALGGPLRRLPAPPRLSHFCLRCFSARSCVRRRGGAAAGGGPRRAAEAAARTAAADSLLPAVLLSPQLRSQTRRCCCGRRRAAGAWPPSYALAKFRPSTGATEDRQNKSTSDRKQSTPDASRDRGRGAAGAWPPIYALAKFCP